MKIYVDVLRFNVEGTYQLKKCRGMSENCNVSLST